MNKNLTLDTGETVSANLLGKDIAGNSLYNAFGSSQTPPLTTLAPEHRCFIEPADASIKPSELTYWQMRICQQAVSVPDADKLELFDKSAIAGGTTDALEGEPWQRYLDLYVLIVNELASAASQTLPVSAIRPGIQAARDLLSGLGSSPSYISEVPQQTTSNFTVGQLQRLRTLPDHQAITASLDGLWAAVARSASTAELYDGNFNRCLATLLPYRTGLTDALQAWDQRRDAGFSEPVTDANLGTFYRYVLNELKIRFEQATSAATEVVTRALNLCGKAATVEQPQVDDLQYLRDLLEGLEQCSDDLRIAQGGAEPVAASEIATLVAELCNETPMQMRRDASWTLARLLDANRAALPSQFKAVKPELLSFVDKPEARAAIASGLAYVDHELKVVFIPYRDAAGSPTLVAFFHLISTEDCADWMDNAQAVKAVVDNRPGVYACKRWPGHGLIINVPMRGLMLIETTPGYTPSESRGTAPSTYHDAYGREVRSYEALVGVDGEIPSRASRLLETRDIVGGLQSYRMLDGATGESLFSARDEDRNLAVRDDRSGTAIYKSARAWNREVSRGESVRQGYCLCLNTDGEAVKLRFLKRTALGMEVWAGIEGVYQNTRFERSADLSRFVRERALNEPFQGWRSSKILSSDADWLQAEVELRQNDRPETLWIWNAPDGQSYSSGFYADAENHPCALVHVIDRDKLVPVRWIDDRWLVVDRATGKVIANDEVAQLGEASARFVINTQPRPDYDRVDLPAGKPWAECAQAIADARKGDKTVTWTSPLGQVYSNRKYLPDYTLNMNRLIDLRPDEMQAGQVPLRPECIVVAQATSSDNILWPRVNVATGLTGLEGGQGLLEHVVLGDYFRLDDTQLPQLSGESWASCQAHVLAGDARVTWLAPDGLSYYNFGVASIALGPLSQRLVKLGDGDDARMVAIEHIAGRWWNLIDPESGDAICGMLVSNDESGVFRLEFDIELPLQADAAASFQRQDDNENSEIGVPLSGWGWRNSNRFAYGSPWSEVSNAVRSQVEQEQYVEWVAADGTVYDSRLFRRMANARTLAQLKDSDEVVALVQANAADWLVVDPDTCEADYSRVTGRDRNGDFGPTYDLREEVGAFASLVMPEAPESGQAEADANLLARIASEYAAFDAGSRSVPRRFRYGVEDYVAASFGGLESLPDGGAVQVARRVPAQPGAQAEHWLILDRASASPLSRDAEPVVAVENAQAFGSAEYFNRDVSRSAAEATVISTRGRGFSASFSNLDANGNEVWIGRPVDANGQARAGDRTISLRRSPDGGRFVEFSDGLRGGAQGDSETVIEMRERRLAYQVQGSLVGDTRQEVSVALSTGRDTLWKAPDGRIYSTSRGATNNHRLATVVSSSGIKRYSPLSRVFGNLWHEVDWDTGAVHTDALVFQSNIDNVFSDEAGRLNSVWNASLAVRAPVESPVNIPRLEELGLSAEYPLEQVREEIEFLDFAPAASQPGHHDQVAGVLHVRNQIDANLSTRASFAVVRYGKSFGLSADFDYIRGFGGRLVAVADLVHLIDSLDAKFRLAPNDADADKTLRQRLLGRYGNDLPVHNIMMLLSEAAYAYERKTAGGYEVLAVDRQAPSLADLRRRVPGWANYATNAFTVPGLGADTGSPIATNRRSVLIDYNKLEGKLLIFLGISRRGTGTSPLGIASEMISGPVISRLIGVASVNVLSNPNLPGKKSLLDQLQRRMDGPENLQLSIPEENPVVLRAILQDGSTHLIQVASGSVTMRNLGIPGNEYRGIFELAAEKEFSTVQTYSYDGSFIGPDSTASGQMEPALITDADDRLAVAPLLIEAPDSSRLGQARSLIGDIARKLVVEVLIGADNRSLLGPIAATQMANLVLNVARKSALILMSNSLLALGLEQLPDNTPRIGGFGAISSSDPNFSIGIAAMVLSNELYTLAFDHLSEWVPAEWSSRDSGLTHYGVPALGYSAQQFVRLYSNYLIQYGAGFPRGGIDQPQETVGPLLAALAHGGLEVARRHGAQTQGLNVRDGLLQIAQFGVDSFERGTLNALATPTDTSLELIGLGVGTRTAGRAADRLLLPFVQALVESRNASHDGTAAAALADQYRRTYARELPIDTRVASVIDRVQGFEYGAVGAIKSTLAAVRTLPRRIASRINAWWVSGGAAGRMFSTLTSASPTSFYQQASAASLVLDAALASDSAQYLAVFDELMAGIGRGAGFAKPSMSWERNTPEKFRGLMRGQPWNANTYLMQAGPDFVQRGARAFNSAAIGDRLPQELGTFSSMFQSTIRGVTGAMAGRATLKDDVSAYLHARARGARDYNQVLRAIYQYTVESGHFHYLLRYDETGIGKRVDIIDGVPLQYRVLSKPDNLSGYPDDEVSARDVLLVNYGSRMAQKYPGLTYRGVNTLVPYVPDKLANANLGERSPVTLRSGQLVTNTEIFSTSQSGWMAQSFGMGIDQAQLKTTTRLKLVITGETSFNATQLTDLQQAEAIYTPGALFQIRKIEGFADGNDLGQVAYLSQVDTFDWERNNYYLENGMLDKLVRTPGLRVPMAMDPYTGIVSAIVVQPPDGGPRFVRYYTPVNNYFIGWPVDDNQGELARWYRPHDSGSSPEGMRNRIYSMWLSDDAWMDDLQGMVENSHHAYFRKRYQENTQALRDDWQRRKNQWIADGSIGQDVYTAPLNQAQADLAEVVAIDALRDSTTAARLADADATGAVLTSQSMPEKLLVWQLANLLRGEIEVYGLVRLADGTLGADGQTAWFKIDRGYDDVSFSSTGESSVRPKITIGRNVSSGGSVDYFVLRAESNSAGGGAALRWTPVRFMSPGEFGDTTLQCLSHAISIGANASGYLLGEDLDGNTVFADSDASASARYLDMIAKARKLASVGYDRYRHALADFSRALSADFSLSQPPLPTKLKAEPLPVYLRDESFLESDDIPLSYRSGLQQAQVGEGTGLMNLTGVLRDSDGRLLLRQIESNGDIRYLPLRLYESFDRALAAPATLVFENLDPRSEFDPRRFYVWSRTPWDEATTDVVVNTDHRIRAQSYLPAHEASLVAVNGGAVDRLFVDENRNLFLRESDTTTRYVPLVEQVGFRNLIDDDAATAVYADLSDSAGRRRYLWRRSGWQNTAQCPVQQWLDALDAGLAVHDDKAASSSFLRKPNPDGPWTAWSFRHAALADGGGMWKQTLLAAGDAPRQVGDYLIYSTVANDATAPVLRETGFTRAARLPALAAPAFERLGVRGTAQLNGIQAVLYGDAQADSQRLCAIVNGQALEVVRLFSDGGTLVQLNQDGQSLWKQIRLVDDGFTASAGAAGGFAGGRPWVVATGAANVFAVEAQPGMYVLAEAMGYVAGDEAGGFVTKSAGNKLKIDGGASSWASLSAPSGSAGSFPLTVWRASKRTASYWDPLSRRWTALPLAQVDRDGFLQTVVWLAGQELQVQSLDNSDTLDLRSFGRRVTEIAADGTLICYTTGGIRVELTHAGDHELADLTSLPGYVKGDFFSTGVASFVQSFVDALGVMPLNSVINEKVTQYLAMRGFTTSYDLSSAAGCAALLEVLRDLYDPSINAIDRNAFVLHYRDGARDVVDASAFRPAASAYHFLVDRDSGIWSSMRWGASLTANWNQTGYTLPVPFALNAPVVASRPLAELATTQMRLNLLSLQRDAEASQQAGEEIYRLLTQEYGELRARQIPEVHRAASGSQSEFDAWIYDDAERSTLLIREGNRITMQRVVADGVAGASELYAFDLGKRVAYFDPSGAGWRSLAVETDASGALVRFNNRVLRSTGITGTHAELTIGDGGAQARVVAIDRDGALLDASGRSYPHLDASLLELTETRGFRFGSASGVGNNCLIHSILQVTAAPTELALDMDKIEARANRIRALMIQRMTQLRATDPTVTVIGANEQIDVADPNQRRALVWALRNDTETYGFTDDMSLVIHAGGGLVYQADDGVDSKQAVHIWYETSGDYRGQSGHFSPIIGPDPRWSSTTYLDPTTGAFTVVPDRTTALGSDLSATPRPDTWTDFPVAALNTAAGAATTSDPSFNFGRQVIVQLNGDTASYEAARDLFLKHPRDTDWVQARPGNDDVLSAVGWSATNNEVHAVSPLSRDTRGDVRIVLVGHTVDGTNGQRVFADASEQRIAGLIERLMRDVRVVTGVHLDLVGCELLRPVVRLEETTPGRLMLRLMDLAQARGIPYDRVSTAARLFPVRVTEAGKKEILGPDGVWRSKEDDRLWDVVHKVDIFWDEQAGRLVQAPFTGPELTETSSDIAQAFVDLDKASAMYQRLYALNEVVTGLVRERLGMERQGPAEHRDAVEQAVESLTELVKLAVRWQTYVTDLRDSARLGTDWIPLVDTRIVDGVRKLRFVNKTTGESRWLDAPDEVVVDFERDIGQKLTDINTAALFDSTTGEGSIRPDATDAQAATTVNAAFLFKTLIDLGKSNTKLSDLSTVAQVQMYAQLTQNSLTLIDDAVKMAGLISKGLQAGEKMFARILSAAGKGGTALAVIGDVVNIVTSAIQYANETDPAVKESLKAQLALASISLTLTLVAAVAAVVGATTLSEVTGGAANIIVGLVVSVPYLAQLYESKRVSFDQARDELDRVYWGIHPGGPILKDGVYSFGASAAIRTIRWYDLDNDLGLPFPGYCPVTYATVEINATTGGSGHTVTDDFDHYFSRPDPTYQKYLNLYLGMGLNSLDQNYVADESNVMLLPSGPSRRYTFEYSQVTGRRYAEVTGFSALRSYYGTEFVYLMYALPTDWGIVNLTTFWNASPVDVLLKGNKDKVLIVPTIANLDASETSATEINAKLAELRGKLSYWINANKAITTVMLPSEPIALTVGATDAGMGQVIIVADAAIRTYSARSDHFALGAYKPNVVENVTCSASQLYIGGQTIWIAATKPKSLSILCGMSEQNDGVKLMFDVDLTTNVLRPVMFLQTQDSTHNQLSRCLEMLLQWPGLRTAYQGRLLVQLKLDVASDGGQALVRSSLNKGKDLIEIVQLILEPAGVAALGAYLGYLMKGDPNAGGAPPTGSLGTLRSQYEFVFAADALILVKRPSAADPDATVLFMRGANGCFQDPKPAWKRDAVSYEWLSEKSGTDLFVIAAIDNTQVIINGEDLSADPLIAPVNHLAISTSDFTNKIQVPLEAFQRGCRTSIGGLGTGSQAIEIVLPKASTDFVWGLDGSDLIVSSRIAKHILRLESAYLPANNTRIVLRFSDNISIRLGDVTTRLPMATLGESLAIDGIYYPIHSLS